MLRLPALVLATFPGFAVLQLPGGLIGIDDPRALLIAGDSVSVDLVDANDDQRTDLWIGPFNVLQQGELAVLWRESGRVPLVLPSRAPLPARVALAVRVEPAEADEGVAGVCPPCPDFDPEHVRACIGGASGLP